jgi:hypothetical protein
VVVGYGSPQPERHRLENSLAGSFEEEELPEWEDIDAEHRLARVLFSNDPADETKADRPIYWTTYKLNELSDFVNAAFAYPHVLQLPSFPSSGKAGLDVAQMVDLVDISRRIVDGTIVDILCVLPCLSRDVCRHACVLLCRPRPPAAHMHPPFVPGRVGLPSGMASSEVARKVTGASSLRLS